MVAIDKDPDISKMLTFYFGSHNYQIHVKDQNADLLKTCLDYLPEFIILGVNPYDRSADELYQRL